MGPALAARRRVTPALRTPPLYWPAAHPPPPVERLGFPKAAMARGLSGLPHAQPRLTEAGQQVHGEHFLV